MSPTRITRPDSPNATLTDRHLIVVVLAGAEVVAFVLLLDAGHTVLAACVLGAGVLAALIAVVWVYRHTPSTSDVTAPIGVTDSGFADVLADAASAVTIPRPWTASERTRLMAEPPLFCGQVHVDLKAGRAVVVTPNAYPLVDLDDVPADEATRAKWAVMAADFRGQAAAELERITAILSGSPRGTA